MSRTSRPKNFSLMMKRSPGESSDWSMRSKMVPKWFQAWWKRRLRLSVSWSEWGSMRVKVRGRSFARR